MNADAAVADSLGAASEANAALAVEKEGVSARIYGQPLSALPDDLYIPPDALSVMLQAFEGPLDLLLYLIRKSNINILDIPMADLTRQYLAYIGVMRQTRWDLASDYLLMAAMLIDIKARLLLPKPVAGTEEDAADPRAELVRRLLEYEKMKQAAAELNDLPQAGRDFYWADVVWEKPAAHTLPTTTAQALADAFRALLKRRQVNQSHRIHREELSVREHMGQILRHLRDHAGVVCFETLFSDNARPAVWVVHFLAILELARERLIDIVQSASFAPIYLSLPSGQTKTTTRTTQTNGTHGINNTLAVEE